MSQFVDLGLSFRPRGENTRHSALADRIVFASLELYESLGEGGGRDGVLVVLGPVAPREKLPSRRSYLHVREEDRVEGERR
jgi:hypothetical protein